MQLRREEEALGMQLRHGDGKQLNYFRGQFRNSSFPSIGSLCGALWKRVIPRNRGNQYLKALLIAWLSEGIFSFWVRRKGLLKWQSSRTNRNKTELTFGVHMKNGLFVINFASSCTAPGVSTLFFAAQFFVWFWLLSALPREKILDSSKKPGFEIRSVTLLRCGGSLSLTSLSIRWAFAN